MTEIYNRYKDHILWLGGDANLPDIDWKTDTITGHGYPASINHLYTDTINDIGCEQIVDFPTRLDNTLDIFCTNRPSLIDRCVPFPGLGDHNIVLVDSSVLPSRKKPVKRGIITQEASEERGLSLEEDQ